jgi:hypothetical protein
MLFYLQNTISTSVDEVKGGADSFMKNKMGYHCRDEPKEKI